MWRGGWTIAIDIATYSTPGTIATLRSISKLAGIGTTVVGTIVIIGWQLNNTTLKSLIPDPLPMEANSALAFIMVGAGLLLSLAEPRQLLSRRLGQAFSLAAIVIGAITLLEYLLGWDFGFDRLLTQVPAEPIGITPAGRMAPNAALCFPCLGLAVLLIDVQVGSSFRPAEIFCLMSSAISLVTMIGYTYGLPSLHRFGSYTQMPMETAVTCFLLSIGILLARPARGLAAIIARNTIGGVVARRILPLVIFYPLVMGLLRLLIESWGMSETKTALALLLVLYSALLPVLVWWVSVSVDWADRARRMAERDIHELNNQLEQENAHLKALLEKRESDSAGYRDAPPEPKSGRSD